MNIKPGKDIANDGKSQEEKMQKLKTENSELKEKIDIRINELNSLKDQLIVLNPDKKLHDNLKILFSKINELK